MSATRLERNPVVDQKAGETDAKPSDTRDQPAALVFLFSSLLIRRRVSHEGFIRTSSAARRRILRRGK